ncbi:putative DNA single-strand annealing protein SSAP [uncultured Mediterranean phage uvMED]|nr:putative DNA single-strand annealing protein SSAP [uncultured Mediterranean phage uvMED]
MSELTKALIGFHKAVDKIEKNARANYGKFADLANVLSTVTPALHANGLAITQTFLEDSLVTTLHHTSGETLNSTVKLYIQDGRNITQEWGKSVTYQRRYAICSILGIVADMDTDAEAEAPTSAKTTPAQTKPANVQKAVMSQAFQAGQKAIKAAKTLDSLSDLSKRVADRFEKDDLTKQEYDDLLKLLLDKESELNA